MIGAFAYGWPLMKDPVGGVQPIEYMLKLTEPPKPAEPGFKEDASRADAGRKMHWNVLDALPMPGARNPRRRRIRSRHGAA
jgi:hypothetical protein